MIPEHVIKPEYSEIPTENDILLLDVPKSHILVYFQSMKDVISEVETEFAKLLYNLFVELRAYPRSLVESFSGIF